MRPRVFSISQQDLLLSAKLCGACGQRARSYKYNDVCTGSSARTQLLAHATFTGPLGSEPTWTDENNPGMKVNQIVDIELPTAQRVHACFKGNIPPGGYSLAGAYSEAYPPAENFRK